MKKEATSYRLSIDAKQLIKLLAGRLGVNETSVVELAIRELAEKKGLNKMSFQQAINASQCNAAQAEYNGMQTTVDGSSMDGTFEITTGVQGMPTTEYKQVVGIEAAVKVIQEKGLLDKDWEPVNESES